MLWAPGWASSTLASVSSRPTCRSTTYRRMHLPHSPHTAPHSAPQPPTAPHSPHTARHSPQQPPTARHSPPQPALTSPAHVQGHPGGSYRAAVCAGAGAPSRFEVTARLSPEQSLALSAGGGGGGGGVGGGVVALLVLLGLGLLGGGFLGWRNPRAVGHARDKAASLLPSSLRRCVPPHYPPPPPPPPPRHTPSSRFYPLTLCCKPLSTDTDVLSRDRQPLAACYCHCHCHCHSHSHPHHAAPPLPGTRSSRASVALHWRGPTRLRVCGSTLEAAAPCSHWRWPTASPRRPSRWRLSSRHSAARPCRSARLRPEATC